MIEAQSKVLDLCRSWAMARQLAEKDLGSWQESGLLFKQCIAVGMPCSCSRRHNFIIYITFICVI